MEDKHLDIATSAAADCADRIGMAKLAKLAFDGADLRRDINKIKRLIDIFGQAYNQTYNGRIPKNQKEKGATGASLQLVQIVLRSMPCGDQVRRPAGRHRVDAIGKAAAGFAP